LRQDKGDTQGTGGGIRERGVEEEVRRNEREQYIRYCTKLPVSGFPE
jgi:hypothetical protein